MKIAPLFLLVLTSISISVANAATTYRVAPYSTNTTRNTFPYGTAAVGAECEPVTITQSATGSVKHHFLKGQSSPTGVLAPCVAVTVAEPPPPTGMPAGIPSIGAWYDATPTTVTAITSGTATAPTLYSRAGMPEIVGTLNVTCSYCIVDSVKVRGTVRLNGDHIVLRNSEIYGYMPGRNDVVVFANGNNIVIYKNHIHNNGDMTAFENDVGAIGLSNGTKNVWILENTMHHNSGDSVIIGHNHTPGATDAIYIGRNTMYADKENAIDLKVVSNVVVSENVMSDYKPSGSSEGAAIVLHHCHHQTRILNNKISNSQVGVSIASISSTCTPRPVESFVIGNTFDTIVGSAIQMWDGNNLIHVEDNSISNAAVGINLTNCPEGTTVTGNTFTNVTTPTKYSGPTCHP